MKVPGILSWPRPLQVTGYPSGSAEHTGYLPWFSAGQTNDLNTEQQRTLDLETGGYKKTDGQTFSMNRHIRLDAVDKYAIQLSGHLYL